MLQATSSTLQASNKYDAFERRITKEVTTTQGHQVTSYIYDGDQIIAEYDGAGTLLRKYIYGPGIDEPIKGLSPTGTIPEWFYHYDGLGSVTELTNASGSVVEKYEYDAYGKPSTTSTIGNRFMFTGREYDAETGLYYYRARYYSSVIGRFLQVDEYPILIIEPYLLVNKYLYCGNSPTTYIDPYGLCRIPPLVMVAGTTLALEPTQTGKVVIVAGVIIVGGYLIGKNLYENRDVIIESLRRIPLEVKKRIDVIISWAKSDKPDEVIEHPNGSMEIGTATIFLLFFDIQIK